MLFAPYTEGIVAVAQFTQLADWVLISPEAQISAIPHRLRYLLFESLVLIKKCGGTDEAVSVFNSVAQHTVTDVMAPCLPLYLHTC